MAVLYGKFEKPEKLIVDPDKENPNRVRFIAAPFERGFAHTIGNSMRRVLLGSMEAPAIVSVQIEGVPHEFMPVEGFVEDMTNIILNLKGAMLRRIPTDSEPHSRDIRELSTTLEVSKSQIDAAKGSVEICLGDLFEDGLFEVVNPKHHLFTVTKPQKRKIQLKVAVGRGYLPCERIILPRRNVDEILIDACFSPVQQVNYYVENTRVGQDTDFDQLIIDITTDGRITPEEALSFASQICSDHFVVYDELKKEPIEYIKKEDGRDRDYEMIMHKLAQRVDEVELTVRSANCLQKAEITYIWQLVLLPEREMLGMKNFGKKSLNEIRDKIHEMDLALGMDLKSYNIDPENLEEEIEKFKREQAAAEYASAATSIEDAQA